ncbi:DEAD/DEAH box helicase [bacterium]|nr:DEAD/DEAH box helicase [candidate division CSSED10-310 bacterium]
MNLKVDTHLSLPVNDPTGLRYAALEGAFKTLLPNLCKAIAREGYRVPTPVQEQCIPHVLDGQDIIGTAQTGTGKTAAFLLPVMQRLTMDPRRFPGGKPRVLILAPTRELAAQISDSIGTYGRFMSIRYTVIYGGVKQTNQVRDLRRGIDILVATPGRLLDLMQQGYVQLNEIDVFILDEVDRMLDMGFIPDIRRIMSQLPDHRQTMFFSATMPDVMEHLARSMVRENAVRITIEPESPTVEAIIQNVMFVEKRDKDALLISLFQNTDVRKALIFIRMKYAANRLMNTLSAAGIPGVAIHGNKSQAARTRALDGFKQGQFRVMVATDVAARGLDVDDITHVINYDLPSEAETYVHRIGRTARAGASGYAISFCDTEERSLLRGVESLLGHSIPVITDHGYHCELALQAGKPAPRRFSAGRQGGRRYTRLGIPNRSRR